MGKGNKQAVGSRGNTAYKQLIEECEISLVFKEIFLKQNEIHFLPISTFLKIIICNTGQILARQAYINIASEL